MFSDSLVSITGIVRLGVAGPLLTFAISWSYDRGIVSLRYETTRTAQDVRKALAVTRYYATVRCSVTGLPVRESLTSSARQRPKTHISLVCYFLPICARSCNDNEPFCPADVDCTGGRRPRARSRHRLRTKTQTRKRRRRELGARRPERGRCGTWPGSENHEARISGAGADRERWRRSPLETRRLRVCGQGMMTSSLRAWPNFLPLSKHFTCEAAKSGTVTLQNDCFFSLNVSSRWKAVMIHLSTLRWKRTRSRLKKVIESTDRVFACLQNRWKNIYSPSPHHRVPSSVKRLRRNEFIGHARGQPHPGFLARIFSLQELRRTMSPLLVLTEHKYSTFCLRKDWSECFRFLRFPVPWRCARSVVLNREHISPGVRAPLRAKYLTNAWSVSLPGNTYACKLFKVRGSWNKGHLLKGGVVEKRLRTTGVDV